MHSNDREHTDRINTVILEADQQAVAVRLLLFLWLYSFGSADIEKLGETPSGLYSSQAVSYTNDWLQVAR